MVLLGNLGFWVNNSCFTQMLYYVIYNILQFQLIIIGFSIQLEPLNPDSWYIDQEDLEVTTLPICQHKC